MKQILPPRNLQKQTAHHHITSYYATFYRISREIISILSYLLFKKAFKDKFSALKRQLLSYFLIVLISFQHTYTFSQTDPPDDPVPNSDALINQLNEHSLESLDKLEYLESYDPNVPLTINDGSFSLMPGTYEGPSHFPLPDEHYIPHTKLGRSIEYLKDTQLMINKIYYLHNALLSKIEDIIQNIEAKYDQNTQAVLKELQKLMNTNIPFFEENGIGIAELSQVDHQFIVRIVNETTDTAFYILNETIISRDSLHLKKLQARQHFVAGANRLDHQRGRDVILLWVNGRHNTSTVVSPRIEKSLNQLQRPIPFYEDPQQYRLARRKHRRLHLIDYWNAIREPITLNDLSFGTSKAVFQACLMGGVGLAQERLTGENVNYTSIMSIAALLAFIPCSFPSSYRYWLNMGPMGLLQRKDHVATMRNIRQYFNSIDWKETLRSKAVRASISSIILAYGFLFSTYFDDLKNTDDGLTALYLFTVINLIAIPNILLNGAARVWWAEQAFVNELAGVKKGKMKFTNWNRENFDYLWTKYFFYDVTRLVHLAGLGKLPESIIMANSIGINLNDFGINLGLFTLIGSYLVGKFILSRKVLSFQQKGFLDNRRAWSYLNSLQSELGKAFLHIERIYRKALSSWHKLHIKKQNKKHLKSNLLHLYEEIYLDLNLTKKEKQHLQKWQTHQQVQFLSIQELILYETRKKISRVLATLEKDFFKHTSVTMTNSYKQQVRTSFKNLAIVIHGFFETLKAYYYSTIPNSNVDYISQHGDVYLPFWKRYKTPEQEELFKFLEKNITEEFPYIKNGLSLMTNEALEEGMIEISEDLDILLENILKEMKIFFTFKENWQALVSYIDNHEIESLLKNYGPRENLAQLIETLNNDKAKIREEIKVYSYNLKRFSEVQENHNPSLLQNRAYNYDLKRFFKGRNECTSALTK